MRAVRTITIGERVNYQLKLLLDTARVNYQLKLLLDTTQRLMRCAIINMSSVSTVADTKLILMIAHLIVRRMS